MSVATVTELWRMSATELAQATRSRQTSSQEAVQVIGPRYREDLCLDAATALEERVGVITPIDPRWR
jgi:Asp-tRNA(Asn)/Glu-tRNA(Gln) amidotransferase A subunit family amidase